MDSNWVVSEPISNFVVRNLLRFLSDIISNMSEKVFHGSPKIFDAETANPRLNERINENGEVIFSEESFHATPHEWIALAYTYTPKPIEGLSGDNAFYNMGVIYITLIMVTLFTKRCSEVRR